MSLQKFALLGLVWFAAAARAQSDTQALPGLAAVFDDGKTRVRSVAAAPRFYLEPGESAHPSLAPAFRAEWSGLLSILEGGEYRFYPGNAELSIAGARVAAGQAVKLAPGRHAISIRYQRAPGTAAVRLEWESARFAREPAPASVFFHSAEQAPAHGDLLVERGRELAEELGCVNCHTAKSAALRGRRGPHLTDTGARVKREWLYRWLEAPWEFRGAAAMPAVAGEPQRRDIASYLATLGTRAERRGRPPRGGDVGQGGSLFGSVGCAACHSQPGLKLDGMGSKTSAEALAAYLRDPAATDPGGRMPSLMLTPAEAFQLAAYLTESRNAEFERPFSGGDPARGKALVESEGCVACHELRDGEAALENRQQAPELARLNPAQGCLAGQPGAHLPRYRLAAGDRAALQAFLAWYRRHPDVSAAPVHELQARVRQLRCAACHQTDLTPRPPAVAEATPPLTGVGAKLRTGWIESVLSRRARVRHFQQLRMPDYDPRHAAALAGAFAKAEGFAPGDGPGGPALSAPQAARGVGMIGTDPRQKGMGCIGCHDWGEYKSLGEEGPQLINAAERLRYRWYDRWMRNPARILSGTSMPNYFSSMPHAAAGEIIDALWAGMAAGRRMPIPAGLGKVDVSEDREARPVPQRRPIIVRWDMPEATPAAIAVGLPGKLSYCFDAGESRLRYAWRGGFIDLSETLTKKVDAKKLTPTARLVGDVFYRSEAFPLRTGTPDGIPRRRFRGYRLVDGYPEFRYEVDGVEVRERIVAEGAGLARHFEIARVEGPMWFVDGGKTIEVPRGAQVKFTIPVGGTEGGR